MKETENTKPEKQPRGKFAVLKMWDATYTVAELIERSRPDEKWPWRDVYQPIAPAMPWKQASDLYEALSGDAPNV